MSDATEDADDAAPPAGASNDQLTMLKFFQDDGWYPDDLGEGILGMRYRGHSGEWECFADARRPPGQFIFYSVFPVLVPDDDRLRMAELIAWINDSLLVGNFELDLSMGQVRFKTSILLDAEPLTEGLIRPMVYLNAASMDRCSPALHALIETTEQPEVLVDNLLR